jgi:hypothetical protein
MRYDDPISDAIRQRFPLRHVGARYGVAQATLRYVWRSTLAERRDEPDDSQP